MIFIVSMIKEGQFKKILKFLQTLFKQKRSTKIHHKRRSQQFFSVATSYVSLSNNIWSVIDRCLIIDIVAYHCADKKNVYMYIV